MGINLGFVAHYVSLRQNSTALSTPQYKELDHN